MLGLLCAVGFIAIGTANNYIFNSYLPVYVRRPNGRPYDIERDDRSRSESKQRQFKRH
jgi:hypothetical protein